MGRWLLRLAAAALAVGGLARPAGAADLLRIGTVPLTTTAPLFIAADRGFFTAEGIDAKLVFFQSPGPIPLGVASGDLEIGNTGSSASLYALAAQGAFKIIGAEAHEEPGFHLNAIVASDAAYAAGLTSDRGLAGHTIGIAEFGGPPQYAASLVLEKNGVPFDKVRFVALQSNPNVLSAVVGGRTDAAVLPATAVAAAAAKGEIKVIGWVGDETPWQSSALFASTRLLNQNPDLVRRFLIAFRKGTTLFHDAFTAPDGSRRDGPDAPQMVSFLAKVTHLSEAQVRLSISYADPQGRYDFADLERQVAWFQSQKMLKPEVRAENLIDRRFILLTGGK